MIFKKKLNFKIGHIGGRFHLLRTLLVVGFFKLFQWLQVTYRQTTAKT